MKNILRIALYIFLFIFLTLISQIGGVVFLISLLMARKCTVDFRLKPLIIFIGIYLISTLFLVPILASIWGREKVRHSEKIHATNFMTVLLNRNYVRPELNDLLEQTAQKLNGSDIEIHYLDANFPFINKFPLLPHLSHNDGKKIDLSLIYANKQGDISHKQKSVSGYGFFENPQPSEFNQIEKCLSNGYFQYDYPKYLTFGKINQDLVFSEKGTQKLIESILDNKNLGKIFIEPHLKNRMKLSDKRIRYHGCRAVRHDDHIHIQLK